MDPTAVVRECGRESGVNGGVDSRGGAGSGRQSPVTPEDCCATSRLGCVALEDNLWLQIQVPVMDNTVRIFKCQRGHGQHFALNPWSWYEDHRASET
jgi:hypothetical protein